MQYVVFTTPRLFLYQPTQRIQVGGDWVYVKHAPNHFSRRSFTTSSIDLPSLLSILCITSTMLTQWYQYQWVVPWRQLWSNTNNPLFLMGMLNTYNVERRERLGDKLIVLLVYEYLTHATRDVLITYYLSDILYFFLIIRTVLEKTLWIQNCTHITLDEICHFKMRKNIELYKLYKKQTNMKQKIQNNVTSKLHRLQNCH